MIPTWYLQAESLAALQRSTTSREAEKEGAPPASSLIGLIWEAAGVEHNIYHDELLLIGSL